MICREFFKMICECCKFNGEIELQKVEEKQEYPFSFSCEICKAYCIHYVKVKGCGWTQK